VGRELHVSDGENVSGWAVRVVGIALVAHGRQFKEYKAAEAEYRMHR
jgi:hypothetical protein